MGIIGVGSFSQQDGVCKNLGRASTPTLTDTALSPVAVYRLAEGSGSTTANDVAGGQFALTLSGSPTWQSYGLGFQGSKSASGTGTAVTPTQLSVYGVARSTGTPVLAGYGPLISESYGDNQFQIDANANALQVKFGGGDLFVYATKNTDAAWHIWAYTYDGATFSAYMDDALVGAAAATGLGALTINQIFLSNFNNVAFWPGDIGAACVYAIGHTATQVKSVGGLLRTLMAARSVTMTPLAKYVVWEGDSISAISFGFPNVATKASTKGAQGYVAAVAGSALLELTNRSAAVDASYSATRSKNILHVLVGRNDLDPGNNLTAAQFVASLKTYCLARKAVGWTVIVGTILPSTLTGFNTLRNAANTLIKADPSFYDAIADYAAEATMGPDAASSDTTYYSSGTHPTAAGHALLAVVTQAALDPLL